MSVEDTRTTSEGSAAVRSDEPVDLGGGCGGECEGCGVPAARASGAHSEAAPERSAAATSPTPDASSAVGLARMAFVLGLLVGVGLTALVGVVLPEAMPFLAATALVIVSAAGIVAVLRAKPRAAR